MISTEIASIAKIAGEVRAIELLGEAGFDGFDLSLFEMGRYDWSSKSMIHTGHPLQTANYLAFARQLRRTAEDYGMVCNQSHGPYPIYCKEIWDLQRRAIECTAEAGGSICVIHPDNYKSPEENADLYRELLPFAKDHGVKIATENMWCWDDEKDQACFAACCDPESFLAHLNAVDDPWFVACLDIGHGEMRGLNTTAPEMIRALGSHLQALHIHDNDRHHDSHALPYTMDIDFEAVVKALKDIRYDGWVTLEADCHCQGCSAEDLPGKVAEMAAAARRFERELR